MIYSIDFETRSKADLKAVGLDIYANDPTTEVLCIAMGTTPENIYVADNQQEVPSLSMPRFALATLLEHVEKGGKIQAWNAMFEYAIWNCVCVSKYGWPKLKLEQVIDSMAIAAANNIPQNLDEAGQFMNSEYKKDAKGKRLIQKLSKPNTKGVFNEDPELMAELFEYCKDDVRTEMSIAALLRPLTDAEQEIWMLTQRINLRGVPVDPKELEKALVAVDFSQHDINQECLALTGCKPSEREKLLAWVNNMGAGMGDLTAESVTSMLANTNLHPDLRRALELRQEGSQTSVAKYAKMLEIQREGKIRNTLVYHGASTGRWASRGGLNLQNIARPTLEDGQIADAIPRVFNEAKGTMQELSSLVRSAIVAPTGQTFVDVDFSSIENRVGVWLAGQKDKVELFRKGLDEYKTFAAESLYRISYEDVTKDQRQISKSAVLGAMFGQGAKGLVRYAKDMGVILSEGQAKHAVDNYRASYSRVKALWAKCELAAIDAVQNPGTAFAAGDKLILKVAKNALWMKLPSGRLICWQEPQLELLTTPWGAQKMGITVRNQNTYTRKWGRNPLIGSSIFQSAVQGTARDCLAVAALRLDKAGFEMINFVHDEILMLVEEENAETALKDVSRLMDIPPDWALDLPLACEGWISKRYRK